LQIFFFLSFFKKILFISSNSKFQPQKKDLKEIKLTKREVKRLLFFFNRVNICNIENENAIWTELLNVVDSKHSQKILNAKKKFLSFSMKMERKLRKNLRLQNNESSYSKKEKLLITGLVYLELLRYDENHDFNLEKLNFNKSTLKEYGEAKKFISKSFPDFKKNIVDELSVLFKKIARSQRKLLEKKKDSQSKSLENMHETMTPITQIKAFENDKDKLRTSSKSHHHFFYFENPSEMNQNFQEYLALKKYEVLEELIIFEKNQGDDENDETQKIAIEDFIEDYEFRNFALKMNQKNQSTIDDMMENLEEEEEEKPKIDIQEGISPLFPVFMELGSLNRKMDDSRFGLQLREDSLRIKDEEKSFNESYDRMRLRAETNLKKIEEKSFHNLKFNEISSKEKNMPMYPNILSKKPTEDMQIEETSSEEEEKKVAEIEEDDSGESSDEDFYNYKKQANDI